MTEIQNVAYINSQTACALITAMGYTAENKQREILGQSLAYTEVDFLLLLDKFGIHHNSVLNMLMK